MQAQGGDGEWSAWSDVWTFTVDTVKPLKPTLLDPANTSTILTNLPTFDWSDTADTNHYEIQVDNLSTFSSPEINQTNVVGSTYTATTALLDTKFYWRVQAVDAAGNKSGWTPVWNFIVNAVSTPTPVLLTPINATFTNDTTPTLTWDVVPGAILYRVQVDEESLIPRRQSEDQRHAQHGHLYTRHGVSKRPVVLARAGARRRR